jgi:hypothetical protein
MAERHPDADDHRAAERDLEQADAQGDVEEASADERDPERSSGSSAAGSSTARRAASP